jgi:hypothetical protein
MILILKWIIPIHFFENNFFSVSNRMKNILFFNEYFTDPTLKFGFGQEPFIDSKCTFTNCFTTNNRSLLGTEYFDFLFICFLKKNVVVLIYKNTKSFPFSSQILGFKKKFSLSFLKMRKWNVTVVLLCCWVQKQFPKLLLYL